MYKCMCDVTVNIFTNVAHFYVSFYLLQNCMSRILYIYTAINYFSGSNSMMKLIKNLFTLNHPYKVSEKSMQN